MPSESEILTAIGNGGLIEGIDPLYYAAMLRIQLEGKNPVLWAIDNGKKIDGKDPWYYALLNEGFDVNKNDAASVIVGKIVLEETQSIIAKAGANAHLKILVSLLETSLQ